MLLLMLLLTHLSLLWRWDVWGRGWPGGHTACCDTIKSWPRWQYILAQMGNFESGKRVKGKHTQRRRIMNIHDYDKPFVILCWSFRRWQRMLADAVAAVAAAVCITCCQLRCRVWGSLSFFLVPNTLWLRTRVTVKNEFFDDLFDTIK